MSYDELIERVNSLEASGDERGALDLLRKLAAEYREPNLFCRYGWLAKELGETEGAEEAFQFAIKLDPQNGPAHLGLGSIALDRKEYDFAEVWLKKAVSLEPTRAGYTMLGVAHRHLRHDQEARESYLRAIELDPGFEEAYFNLGVLAREKDPMTAEALFTKAISIDPNFGAAYRELGWAQRQRGLLTEAEFHLKTAIKLQPDDAWAHVYLGGVFWENGDLEAASREYEWAHEACPQWSLPIWSMANVCSSKQDWTKAQALFERALEVEPDDAVAHLSFARMLKKKGDLETAIVYVKRALLLDPHYEAAKKLLIEYGN